MESIVIKRYPLPICLLYENKHDRLIGVVFNEIEMLDVISQIVDKESDDYYFTIGEAKININKDGTFSSTPNNYYTKQKEVLLEKIKEIRSEVHRRRQAPR